MYQDYDLYLSPPSSLHPAITTSATQTRSHLRLMEPGNPVFRWVNRPYKLPTSDSIDNPVLGELRSSFRIISISYNPFQTPNSSLFQRSQRLLQAIFPPPTPSDYFRRQGMLTVAFRRCRPLNRDFRHAYSLLCVFDLNPPPFTSPVACPSSTSPSFLQRFNPSPTPRSTIVGQRWFSNRSMMRCQGPARKV